jgi:hypothetical protein
MVEPVTKRGRHGDEQPAYQIIATVKAYRQSTQMITAGTAITHEGSI